jgi:tRNA pseudouridine13 synthase
MDLDATCTVPQWPRLLGVPPVHGSLRMHAEDFEVEELPRQLPCGEGSHLWLLVRKRGANTDWVAGQLARAAACATRDVGFAGLKDRHAVTTQWFSVPAAADAVAHWAEWDIAGVEIVQAAKHQRKLQRGALRGNRFRIVIRELGGDLEELAPRLGQIGRHGLPNYFGPQRFGHDGNNLRQGVRWLLGGGRLPRAKRSIYLSAVRSFLFNQVLGQRLLQGNWDSLLDGEVAMLDGTHSVFRCQLPDAELSRRCREGDVHPTGPLPGRAGFEPERRAAELEQEVLEPYRQVLEALAGARLEAGRRSLRLPVRDLAWELSADRLELAFSLPPGAYATMVVHELVSTGS